MEVHYPESAILRREGYPDFTSGRRDHYATCPNCGKDKDIVFLDPQGNKKDFVAWCPCGCVFVKKEGDQIESVCRF